MVVLTPPGAQKTDQISGVLVDVNGHGFRVRHQHDVFKRNDVVSFLHRFGEGLARVVWSEKSADDFETGFAYVEK